MQVRAAALPSYRQCYRVDWAEGRVEAHRPLAYRRSPPLLRVLVLLLVVASQLACMHQLVTLAYMCLCCCLSTYLDLL